MEDREESDLTQESLVHDLNNVFEMISEAAELLSADGRWDSLAATLTRCVARGMRLLSAIADNTPNLSAVIDDAIQCAADYCLAARRPKLTFVCDFPPDVYLPGLQKDWERVFANLFLNAAQVMRKPGEIAISASVTEDTLRITIADNGPGIAVEILPDLFRAHISTKPHSTRRSGLGLHIVSKIVDRYEGHVTARNREDRTGAVFTIALPVTSK